MAFISNNLNTNSVYVPNTPPLALTVSRPQVETPSAPGSPQESVTFSPIPASEEPLVVSTSQAEQPEAKETPEQVYTSPAMLSYEDFPDGTITVLDGATEIAVPWSNIWQSPISPLVSESGGESTSVPNNGTNPNGTLTMLEDATKDPDNDYLIAQSDINSRFRPQVPERSIQYSSKMGARITSNSWGGLLSDPSEAFKRAFAESPALRTPSIDWSEIDAQDSASSLSSFRDFILSDKNLPNVIEIQPRT